MCARVIGYLANFPRQFGRFLISILTRDALTEMHRNLGEDSSIIDAPSGAKDSDMLLRFENRTRQRSTLVKN